MKKITLLILFLYCTVGFAQQYVEVITTSGSTSAFSRAPQGSQRYIRTCYVIPPSQMTASGFPTATAITALSFSFSTAQDIATSGTLKIYIQNSSDETYAKTSNAWADVISPMTLVHNATTTIPATAGFWDIPFSGGSAFTYTGGGVYVGFEYENATGALATTGNVANCNNTLAASLRNIFSATAPVTDITNSSGFRPGTRFGFTAACSSPTAVTASNITTSSATIAFTAPASTPANGYEYFVSTTNVTPDAATIGTPITGTTFELSALTPISTYYVWVRSVCSASSKSLWSSPSIFIVNTPPPYQYGFEDTTLPGYLLFSGGGGQWGVGNTAGFAATGTGYAVYNFNPTTAAAAWIFTPPVQLAAGTQYSVSFKVRANSTTIAESMKATIGNARNVAAQTTTLWDSGLNGINYVTYANQSGTFTPTVSGGYSIGFNCYSIANRLQLFLDDIAINAALNITENELSKKNVILAPIPVYDTFTIKIENDSTVQKVAVLDLNGRIVRSFDKQLDTYNIADLSPGVYIVSIQSELNTVNKKIIKN